MKTLEKAFSRIALKNGAADYADNSVVIRVICGGREPVLRNLRRRVGVLRRFRMKNGPCTFEACEKG